MRRLSMLPMCFRLKSTPDIEAKIKSFAHLQHGWDYGQGDPIAQPIISAALILSKLLKFLGFSNFDASPGTDGEISIAGSAGEHYLEIIINSDHTLSVAHDLDRRQQFYRLNQSAIEALGSILEATGQLWSAYISYTQRNTIFQIGNGSGRLSEGTKGPYQYLDATASNNMGFLLANTQVNLMDIWNTSVASRPSFGALTQPTYQPHTPSPWMDRKRSAITSSRG